MIKRIPSISCSFVLFHSRDSRRLRDVSFENREKYSGAKDQKREDRDYIRERGRNPSYWLPKSIPLFDGTSWILFNKDVSPFSTNTYTYTYIHRSFLHFYSRLLSLLGGGNFQGLEIHHDGGVWRRILRFRWLDATIDTPFVLRGAIVPVAFGRGTGRLEIETRRNEFLSFLSNTMVLKGKKREQYPLLVLSVNVACLG